MNGGKILVDEVQVNLKNDNTGSIVTVYIDVYDSSLSIKWLKALNHLLKNNYHLEKNYCFFGFADSPRDGPLIIKEINKSIDYINNNPGIDYYIDDHYTMENSIQEGPVGEDLPGGKLIHEHYNKLHRYFEELQGTSGTGGQLSNHFLSADEESRWHIRQLNLLCHEFESWALSKRKQQYLPEWQRPSQLTCWMNAPRFKLDEENYELFGIDTLKRSLGGVYVGVNKAVGKHHWEVFQDEGKEYGRSIDELTTIAMRPQSQAAGDFDIEWANNPGNYEWFQQELVEFKEWLIANGFDPDDKSLTIGHPKIGQVNLIKSFGTEDYKIIWDILGKHLNIDSIKTSEQYIEYPYNWSDKDYMRQQIENAHPTINGNITMKTDKSIIEEQAEFLVELSSKAKAKEPEQQTVDINALREDINKVFEKYGV